MSLIFTGFSFMRYRNTFSCFQWCCVLQINWMYWLVIYAPFDLCQYVLYSNFNPPPTSDYCKNNLLVLVQGRHEKSGELGNPGSWKFFRDCGIFWTKITHFMCRNRGIRMEVWKQTYHIKIWKMYCLRISKLKSLKATNN